MCHYVDDLHVQAMWTQKMQAFVHVLPSLEHGLLHRGCGATTIHDGPDQCAKVDRLCSLLFSVRTSVDLRTLAWGDFWVSTICCPQCIGNRGSPVPPQRNAWPCQQLNRPTQVKLCQSESPSNRPPQNATHDLTLLHAPVPNYPQSTGLSKHGGPDPAHL